MAAKGSVAVFDLGHVNGRSAMLPVQRVESSVKSNSTEDCSRLDAFRNGDPPSDMKGGPSAAETDRLPRGKTPAVANGIKRRITPSPSAFAPPSKKTATAPNGQSAPPLPGVPIYAPLFASRPRVPVRAPAPSPWAAACHPLVDQVSQEVDGWFLAHWPFASEKARRKFVAAGFSRVTCLYYPLAKDERIHFACRLLTILFLIDDLLEDLSFDEGEAYNARLMPIARGDVLPDRNVPVEYMFHDLWEGMRAQDRDLANDILEPTFVFMRAQTDRARKEITELGQYLEYREMDVGKALLSALMRFAMELRLSPAELAEVRPVERNCAKHISVVNDIYSWEKELRQSQASHEEGSVLCSAVKVLADSTALDIAAAKTCLWAMVREWEIKHEMLCSEPLMNVGGASEAKMLYLKGLEYQMSGNEYWSRTTPRYLVVD